MNHPADPLTDHITRQVYAALRGELDALRAEIDRLRREVEPMKPLRDLAKRDGRNVQYANQCARDGKIPGAVQNGPGGKWMVRESDWKEFLNAK